MNEEKIIFELVETNVFTRWPCTICGGCTEKVPILCDVKSGEYKDMLICEQCLKCGHPDDHIRAQIEGLERYIETLRPLLGRIVAPTYEQWEAAMEAHERRWREEHAEEIREVEEMVATRAVDGEECPF